MADALDAFLELRVALEAGTLRAAEPDAAAPTGWRVNAWVKRGILLGFRIGKLEEMNGRHPAGASILSVRGQEYLPGASLQRRRTVCALCRVEALCDRERL